MARSAAAQHDAIALLKEDHKKVQKLFKEFESSKGDEASKQELVEQACNELSIHAQIEEEIFYPAVREAMEEADLIEEAEVEHKVAKDLIGELAELDPGDEAYAATFKVLGEYVNHHIEEEQEEMFPKIKKAGIDLKELGERLLQRKKELESGVTLRPPAGKRRRESSSARH